MNGDLAELRALLKDIQRGIAGIESVDVGIAPSTIYLMPMCKAVADSPIELGAQNVYHEAKGAFTGETSVAMLVDSGCSFVIIGHSERRHVFGETGSMLKKKVAASLGAGLNVIYCVGETLEQREREETESVIAAQLDEALDKTLPWEKLVVAYEPVWAIGTGKNATADQAQEVQRFVRGWLGERYGAEAAAKMRIQYGGSVKPSNAEELLAMPDVDGALVGGASLKADEFVAIIQAAQQRQQTRQPIERDSRLIT